MIRRDLTPRLEHAARHFPVVTVTGPRQSGKTTLCRAVFPNHRYVSLEPLDTRAFASDDPRGFLAQFDGADGVVLDEIQRVPSLLSYLQGMVDDDPVPGRWILTGSQHLGLSQAVSQSLAGRSAVLHLLPLTYAELRRFDHAPSRLWDVVFGGGYPALYDRGVPPVDWLDGYLATYVERDVRTLRNVGDLTQFRSFAQLVAGRTATLQSQAALGSELGIDHKTAGAWLSVLEASWLLMRLPAWSRNVSKRLVRSPRLHLLDTGVACRLLGIRTPDELVTHPLRGALFETWVVSELYRGWLHRHDGTPALSHLRTQKAQEADVLVTVGRRVMVADAKSAATANARWLSVLARLAEVVASAPDVDAAEPRVLFGGDEGQRRSGGSIVAWHALDAWLDEVVRG